MTLPFADKPELSRVYADLKTKTLSQITSTELDALKASIFTEGVNGVEDELRRLLLVQLLTTGIATTGGGGGGTQDVNIVKGAPLAVSSIARYDVTTGGNVDLFTPSSGEVWQLIGASKTNDSNNSTYQQLFIRDTSGSVQDRVKLNGDITNNVFQLNEPIFVTAGTALLINSDISSGTLGIQLGLVQCR